MSYYELATLDTVIFGAGKASPGIEAWVAQGQGRLCGAWGTDIGTLGRRAAWQVHRILGGAKPGDLAVERPSTFKLTLNLKTARALGLTVLQSLLLRADEVIQ